MAIASSTAAILTCAVPAQGLGLGFLRDSARGLLWRKNERRFLRKAGVIAVTAKFELKPPPYPLDALEPHMTQETLEYHWGKHHRTYVENLNKQIYGTELDESALEDVGTELDDESSLKDVGTELDEESSLEDVETELDELSLEDVMIANYNKGDMLPAFNNAAQAWNHEFFWESMKPGGGGKPSGDLLAMIVRDFGSFERFVEEFKAAAATQFGSGWAWLAYKATKLNVGNAVNPLESEEDRKLVIVKSPNAVNPRVWDYYPLLTIDVWEHAYYLDFQSRRPDYISTFMEKLVSWDAVSSRLEKAKARVAERDREEERKKEEKERDVGLEGHVRVLIDNGSDELL